MLVEIKKINKEEVTVCTSLDVAETFQKRHDHVVRDIENVLKEISPNLGTTLFYEDTYKDSLNRKQKQYVMNRDGFTLLVMGYTGEKAMKFKLDYIKQFNAMEKALRSKYVEREKGIAVRQVLTKALQQSTEDERMHGHAYSTYTNCIYKALFGKNAKQLREEFGIDKKADIRDCFDNEQLQSIKSMEMLVSGLVACGWNYEKIKEFIQKTNTKQIAN
ncbi:Rha family transcriptional regulator [Clostridium neonatale]|uniref:Rha family transcriptional regulator n=1 Tax=Clostridium neonatale TaxID=137838 RepID=UPI00291BC5D6|nr:Rha family transcriptional regulator [Clostridium neonatale]CAI3224052.1 Rha family transcriptional regulator [Clostridium neonatale]CAI3562577.1 Rha family transcriptional regulator [Clostridium neonatale]CAI3591209.1 Rha family transcriptional regulator [Clostridium neonatale]